AAHGLSFSTAIRPISTMWPISSSGRTSGGRSNPSSFIEAAWEFALRIEMCTIPPLGRSAVLSDPKSQCPEMFTADCADNAKKNCSFPGCGQYYHGVKCFVKRPEEAPE